jgi:predicted phage terminase large subunit-like protein
MQQRPNPAGGGVFKSDWWQWLDVPPQIQWRAIYADTAQKTKEQNDYSVFQCWGKATNGQSVLLDMVRGKFEAPELLERARAFWAKHKQAKDQGALRAFKIEDKVSGTGLIQQLRKEGKPVLPIKRSTDKLTRAYDAAPYIESGNVVLLRNVPHISDMMAEAEAFPNGAHDDTLDPMMDAVADMNDKRQSKATVSGVHGLW